MAGPGASSGRGFGLRRSRRALSEINVVPYIDVTLVLLIIFMVTAPMIVTGTIDLPRVGQSSKNPVAAIEVTVRRDGSHGVRLRQQGAEETRVSRSELAEAVRALAPAPDSPVIILAEREVPYDTVVQALNSLQAAGLGRVGLAVRQD
ncbi:MAG: ExbD/TolR family protein [Burkholderiaceae bacterium]|jgi:biopolymer transport protein TolR